MNKGERLTKSLIIAVSASLVIMAGILVYALIPNAAPAGESGGAYIPTESEAPEPVAEASVSVSGDSLITIGPETLIIYEYLYSDGSTERTEEFPPYFLLDKPREYFESALADWEILEFGSGEVLLRKNIDGKSTQYYIIGIHEGLVAVFYEDEINGTCLKEITDTPVKTLPPEEQETLRNGIRIFGNDALAKALEDFGS